MTQPRISRVSGKVNVAWTFTCHRCGSVEEGTSRQVEVRSATITETARSADMPYGWGYSSLGYYCNCHDINHRNMLKGFRGA